MHAAVATVENNLPYSFFLSVEVLLDVAVVIHFVVVPLFGNCSVDVEPLLYFSFLFSPLFSTRHEERQYDLVVFYSGSLAKLNLAFLLPTVSLLGAVVL